MNIDERIEKFLNENEDEWVYVLKKQIDSEVYLGAYETKKEAEKALKEYLEKNPHYIRDGLDNRIVIEKMRNNPKISKILK